jgi:magnesium transporter
MLMAVCHSETGWSQVNDLDLLSDLRAEAGNLLWAEADVANLTSSDVGTIAEEFELDDLAVEDAVHTRQRPKVEGYETHLFVVFHQLDEEDGQLEATQIACFVGDRYVLTIHAGADRTLAEARRRWEKTSDELDHPSYLLHTLLDVVVDDYQRIADRLEDEIEQLEEIVLETPDAPVQRQLYSLKQQVARLRRYVLPGVRLLDWVIDPDTDKPFSDRTAALFRDVHDHLLRISDQVRNIDDLAQAVIDLTRAEQATALNVVTRRLTAWAAIFAVGTMIAGIYGMNFKLIPQADGTLAPFLLAVGLMILLGVLLFVYFKRRDWI